MFISPPFTYVNVENLSAALTQKDVRILFREVRDVKALRFVFSRKRRQKVFHVTETFNEMFSACAVDFFACTFFAVSQAEYFHQRIHRKASKLFHPIVTSRTSFSKRMKKWNLFPYSLTATCADYIKIMKAPTRTPTRSTRMKKQAFNVVWLKSLCACNSRDDYRLLRMTKREKHFSNSPLALISGSETLEKIIFNWNSKGILEL